MNPLNQKPFYIGKGKGDRITSTDGRNEFWHRTVNKYGLVAIKLVDGVSECDSLEIEKQYIQKYKLRKDGGTLVNLTYGGAGGNTISEHNAEQHRLNSSKAKMGSRNPNFGKPTWRKGLKLSDAEKENLKQHRLGKKLSPETKVKVLAGLAKGAKISWANKTHKVRCLVTGKIWMGRQECVKELGITIPMFKYRIFCDKPTKGNHLQLIKNQ